MKKLIAITVVIAAAIYSYKSNSDIDTLPSIEGRWVANNDKTIESIEKRTSISPEKRRKLLGILGNPLYIY